MSRGSDWSSVQGTQDAAGHLLDLRTLLARHAGHRITVPKNGLEYGRTCVLRCIDCRKELDSCLLSSHF